MLQSLPQNPTAEHCCIGTKLSTYEPLGNISDPNNNSGVQGSVHNALKHGGESDFFIFSSGV
jgi:hypothetical protein